MQGCHGEGAHTSSAETQRCQCFLKQSSGCGRIMPTSSTLQSGLLSSETLDPTKLTSSSQHSLRHCQITTELPTHLQHNRVSTDCQCCCHKHTTPPQEVSLRSNKSRSRASMPLKQQHKPPCELPPLSEAAVAVKRALRCVASSLLAQPQLLLTVHCIALLCALAGHACSTQPSTARHSASS